MGEFTIADSEQKFNALFYRDYFDKGVPGKVDLVEETVPLLSFFFKSQLLFKSKFKIFKDFKVSGNNTCSYG